MASFVLQILSDPGDTVAKRMGIDFAVPTLLLKPYTLHPAPYTLHPTPYTLHPTTYTLHPKP